MDYRTQFDAHQRFICESGRENMKYIPLMIMAFPLFLVLITDMMRFSLIESP